MRLETFGDLGHKLLRKLIMYGIRTRVVGLEEQRREIRRIAKTDILCAAAYSLLYAVVPIQVDGGTYLVEPIIKLAFNEYIRAPVEEELLRKDEEVVKLFKPKRN